MYDDREGKDVSGHDKSLDVRKGLNPKASTASPGDQIGSCGNPAGQRCPWGKLHRLGPSNSYSKDTILDVLRVLVEVKKPSDSHKLQSQKA
ncbi:hypothetical protein F2Q69_00018212 [Brassica cretica]|uniref:Uncharacterized protein n=1 Tax=Brassica cretica TaxID=69181 RepID=A0A8S9QBU4_BRACR|nr:hypothetical protein F2Q69_00018212 [Brassica cretica]